MYSAESNNNNGWILYYSEEGYPYYYNEFTGDSQWANFQDTNEQQYPEHLSEDLTENNQVYHNQVQYSVNPVNNSSDNNHNYDNQIRSDNDEVLIDEYNSEEDDSDFSVESSVEERFEEYMGTEEGQAELQVVERYINAIYHINIVPSKKEGNILMHHVLLPTLDLRFFYELEKERIAKRLEMRISRESLAMEKLYFLSLHNAKKETNDIPISVSTTAVSNSGLTMFLAQTLRSMRNLFFIKQSNKAFNDKSKEDDFYPAGTAIITNSADGRRDDFGRETKRRLLSNSTTDTMKNVVKSQRMLDTAEISDSNPSSDSESQLSSDDSDLEIINAPLLSELPSWKSALSLLFSWQPQIWPTAQNLASLLLSMLLKILVLLQAFQTFLNPFALRLLRLLSAKEMIPQRPNERTT